LKDSPFDLHYMPAHEAAENFPATLDDLSRYSAVILSDIGSNTILLHPHVWLRSETFPNRLKLLRDWVGAGGALAMIGGYFSFQGIDGRARWARTPVEEILPVTCLFYDDRVEIPEGAVPVIKDGEHPIVKGISGPWPLVLGVNEVRLREDRQVQLIAALPGEHGGHPLLAATEFGRGRTAVWTSDIGPHWLSPEFCAWTGYKALWLQMLMWLTRELE
jgi:uncharacterized membrane protein